ncbi:cytochrome B [Marinicauda salina]|uniref:Cytochrome B n=1 Tax=Marinicauda salina TaxID=2135793 RepID=A0A2U2BU89_9PROT|nr:cytochrome b [Marinicauda salina]PWE17596.1 cytochrome B [Marinicauda salina]
MNRPSTETRRYTTIAIAFHWTIAILLVGMVFYGWWMEEVRDAAFDGEVSVERASAVYNWHKTIGLTILVLSLGRLAWRLGHKPPALPAAMPGWERLAARFTHVAFYAIMIGAPIAGYVAASSYGEGFPILAFNAVELPKLPVPRTEDFHEAAGSIHGAVGWVILVLLAVHAGAAFKHHFVDRDGVLTRMIPGLNRPAQKSAQQ